MARIIPFPDRRLRRVETSTQDTPPALPVVEEPRFLSRLDLTVGGNAEIERELRKLVSECFAPSCEDSVECEDLPTAMDESFLKHLEALPELVVFSPEIQQDEFGDPTTSEDAGRSAEWGDVFLKVGEEYPFLFTTYTAAYVQKQLACHGERIRGSARDVILGRKQLTPGDIVRAVLKWVNLHCPALRGKPVHLEEPAVLRELVCDPGIEVVVPDPS